MTTIAVIYTPGSGSTWTVFGSRPEAVQFSEDMAPHGVKITELGVTKEEAIKTCEGHSRMYLPTCAAVARFSPNPERQ